MTLLLRYLPLYQSKPVVQDVVTNDKRKLYKPYIDLVDEAFSHHSEGIIDNHNAFGEIENDETV